MWLPEVEGGGREVIPGQDFEGGQTFFRQTICGRMYQAKRTAFAKGKGSRRCQERSRMESFYFLLYFQFLLGQGLSTD